MRAFMQELAIAPDTIPADAMTLVMPDDTPLPEWINVGRTLATRKRNIDWLIGDWIAHGRSHFPDQIELGLEAVSDDPKRIARIEKTVAAFPAHMRVAKLSFDHHAKVADMPSQEALPLLQLAVSEKLGASRLGTLAMLRKIDIGQNIARDVDPEYDHIIAMARLWNKAPVDARQEFADMIAECHLGTINP